MSLKPWYKVVTPREDLRQGKPLDASEFAVHLDQVREGRAPVDYQDPARFFERTYLTRNLMELAAGVIRRLSGIRLETSAVYNMATQFGGGKTHALAMLYHLASNGPRANEWKGVRDILSKADVSRVPSAATAVFVGTEFDSLTGRGGDDGTPLRRMPWGEIAFQLGGAAAFAAVEEHEKQRTAPSAEVIRKFLPKNRATLILMDEIMNYVSRSRKSGLGAQLYSFMHNLSEEVRAHANVVLAVSVPASELEMTSEDQSDYERLKKLLDRLGKAVIMSAEQETSEIIRRRLFEWSGLTDDAKKTASDCAEWIVEHKTQMPGWFPVDAARDAFLSTYPFHPSVLSVFERKWRALPRFQQTRGILRLLALWVSRAYQDGFIGAHKDPLITLGTAPLEDSFFRPAVLEQLGEPRLEGAVTTDIAGKKDAHALRLDVEAVETIRKVRLHRKVATAIFFESNGGQARSEATLPEIRLAVAEPGLDIGNVETALEALASSCYYLSAEKNRYRFSLSPNLNKLLADRRASVKSDAIDHRVRAEVQKVFAAGAGLERVYFPEKSGQIPDRPALTLVVLAPETGALEKATRGFVESVTREHGASARTFKSALVWAVPEMAATLREEARKLLAWEDIESEQDALRLDDGQRRQLHEHIKGAQRDLREAVWRAYKNVWLLDKRNELKAMDLGLVHSSSADSLVSLILGRLRTDGDVEDGVSPGFLSRNWPPAFVEWSTRAVRDAFFASPQFPRLLRPDAVKDAIARGVQDGTLAYVGKRSDGRYSPFHWNSELRPGDVEIADDMYVIRRETAESLSAGEPVAPSAGGSNPAAGPLFGRAPAGATAVSNPPGAQPNAAGARHAETAAPPGLLWEGDVPYRKWNSFYRKFLEKIVDDSLKLTIRVEVKPRGGIAAHKIDELRAALRELGLGDDVNVSPPT